MPRSLATTRGITFVLFSYRYLDVSVPCVCLPYGMICLQHTGLTHSEIFASTVICTYTKLIAAYHVLHRLWEPRHPPYALIVLLDSLFFSVSKKTAYFYASISNWYRLIAFFILVYFPTCQRTGLHICNGDRLKGIEPFLLPKICVFSIGPTASTST